MIEATNARRRRNKREQIYGRVAQGVRCVAWRYDDIYDFFYARGIIYTRSIEKIMAKMHQHICHEMQNNNIIKHSIVFTLYACHHNHFRPWHADIIVASFRPNACRMAVVT